MRCAYAVALLTMGPSAVLSGVLPLPVPVWVQVADIAAKCPTPVWNQLGDIADKYHVAQKSGYTEPLLTQLDEIVAKCNAKHGLVEGHKLNLTQNENGLSNSSAQLPHVYARQEPDESLGKRYSPNDPGFLAAVTEALYHRRWAFSYDKEAFWTSHVAQPIMDNKYDEIWTMAQEKTLEQRRKADARAHIQAAKEEKKRIKADKKAKKKAEKEAWKHMTDEERKQKKKDDKEKKDADKAAEKRLKKAQKAAAKAAKEETKRIEKENRENEKKEAKEKSAIVKTSENAYFSGGGGPAIGEDDLEWTQ